MERDSPATTAILYLLSTRRREHTRSWTLEATDYTVGERRREIDIVPPTGPREARGPRNLIILVSMLRVQQAMHGFVGVLLEQKRETAALIVYQIIRRHNNHNHHTPPENTLAHGRGSSAE